MRRDSTRRNKISFLCTFTLSSLFLEYGCAAGTSGHKEQTAARGKCVPCPHGDLVPLERQDNKVDNMLDSETCKGQEYNRGPGIRGIRDVSTQKSGDICASHVAK